MKQQLFFAAAAVLAVSAATPALAQYDDSSWTGFYVGLNVGGSWGQTGNSITASNGTGSVTIPPGDITTINGIAADDDNSLKFTGGAEAGLNWQMGSILLGIETDFGAFDVKQEKSTTFASTGPVVNPPGTPVNFTLSQTVSTDWIWTVRPRIGVANGPWLFYGTGGIAMAPIKLDTTYTDTRSPPNTVTLSKHNTKTGWTAGLGGAYAFSDHWSAKAEWLYSDFGTVTATATSASGFASLTSEAKVRAHLIRVGLDFSF